MLRTEALKKRLFLLGWTQAHLARVTGLSPKVVSGVLRGEHLKAPTVKLIVEALGLDMSRVTHGR